MKVEKQHGDIAEAKALAKVPEAVESQEDVRNRVPVWVGRLGLDFMQACFPAVGVIVALSERSLGKIDLIFFYAVFGLAFLLYLLRVQSAQRTDRSIWMVFLVIVLAGIVAAIGALPEFLTQNSLVPLMVIASYLLIQSVRRLETFLE